MLPFTLGANVSELQVPTYSPEEERIESATSTQPGLDWSLAMSNDVVVVSTKETEVEKPVVQKRTALAVPRVRPDEEYVVDKILQVFPDAPIMVQVARCESGLDPQADRITHDGRIGVDVGLFQINQVHLTTLNELGLDRYDLDDNLIFARMLYDARGLADWYMSEHCWGKYI